MTPRSSQSHSHTIPPPARSFVVAGGPIGILLVHGFAGSIADLRPLAHHFSQAGYSIVGVRLPGHGLTVDDLHLSRAEDWEAAVRQGLTKFPESVKKIVVVGESMGGLLGLLAYTSDRRVRALILLVPPFRVARERSRLAASRLLPPSTRRRKPWVGKEEAAAHLAKGSLLELTVRSYREFLGVVDRARRRLPAVRVPMLAIFSKADQQISPASKQVLHTLATSPVQIVELDGGGHHLAIGAHARELEAAVDAFMAQLP